MGMRRSTSPTRISDSPMTLCRAYLSTANTWNWIILLSSWNGSILNKNRSLKTGSVECFCIYNKKRMLQIDNAQNTKQQTTSVV